MDFKRIEVVTSLYKLSDLQKALGKLGVTSMTVIQALGCGVENGTQEYELEKKKTPELLPKQMVMLVVESSLVDKVIDVIKKELYTGHIGDGKIFVSTVTNIIRVRTGEEGEAALN